MCGARWPLALQILSPLKRASKSPDVMKTLSPLGGSCRIFARRIYRALGAEDIRDRRSASEEVLLRCLLSLDYVLEHLGLPWLPTEPEEVRAFEALGIERRLLPVRVPSLHPSRTS